MKLHYEHEYEKLPLRYELLFNGDNHGWMTGIHCVLDCYKIWAKHTVTEDDVRLLKEVLENQGRDRNGNYIEYQWIVNDFIDMARCIHPDHKIEFQLAWIDGSIFAVPVDMNEHEMKCLYGDE